LVLKGLYGLRKSRLVRILLTLKLSEIIVHSLELFVGVLPEIIDCFLVFLCLSLKSIDSMALVGLGVVDGVDSKA
jgi:hypothetical protein